MRHSDYNGNPDKLSVQVVLSELIEKAEHGLCIKS